MGSLVQGVSKGIGGLGSSLKGALGVDKFKAKGAPIDKSAFTQKLAGAGSQEALRKRQLAQSGRLEARATGQAPSLAEAQMKQASNRTLAQQLGAAQASRGGNAAARERMLAKSQARSGRELAEQSGIAKIKEQQLAESSLAQQLQAQRAQDVALSQQDVAAKQALEKLKVQQNLGLQGLNLSGQQSAAQQRSGLMENLSSGFGLLSSMSDKNQKKNIKKEDFKKGSKAGKKASDKIKSFLKKDNKASDFKKGSEAGKRTSTNVEKFMKGFSKSAKSKSRPKLNTAYGKSLASKMAAEISDETEKNNIKLEAAKESAPIAEAKTSDTSISVPSAPSAPPPPAKKESKGGGGILGFASMLSDKDEKENVKDFNPKSFLDKLQAYSYDYKNPKKAGAGEGRFLSVMAQDLEKAGPVGRSMVEVQPDGVKAVNYGKGFGAILAAQAHLNQRLSEVEKKKNKK